MTIENHTPIDDEWENIVRTHILAHEITALFEEVAEDRHGQEEDEEAEDGDGRRVNLYMSPLSLWEVKTGRVSPVRRGGLELWSSVKKFVISHALGEAIAVRPAKGVIRHDTLPFMAALCDMEASDDHGQSWTPVLAMPVPSRMQSAWPVSDGVMTPPPSVYLKAQYIMSVFRADACHVVAFFDGRRADSCRVSRDDEMIAEIEETVASFWACVQEDRPPEPSGASDDSVMARVMAERSQSGPVIDATQNNYIQQILARKEELNATKKEIEEEISAIQSALKERMDGYSAMRISESHQLVWNRQPEKEIRYTRKPVARLMQKKIPSQA